MPITTDRIAKLREFGLSEYAARTYLALLDLGTSEARDVSGLSKVPASKIYHILDQLHEKGLVVILPEFPRKYEPVPFAEFLQRIHDEHVAAAAQLREQRPALEQVFAVTANVSGSDRGGFALLRGRRNGLERMEEMLKAAREEILLLSTSGLARNPAVWRAHVEEASERGVRVRLVLPAEVENVDLARELSGLAQVRERPAGTGGHAGAFLLVDRRHALITHFLPDDGHASEGNDTALYADQEGVLAALEDLMETPWRESRPVAENQVPVRGDQGAGRAAAIHPPSP